MNRTQKSRFNKARKLALVGDFEKAIPIFETISNENHEAANASLAEIYGFLFDWQNCLDNAGKFVANPKATYAGNIFENMICLIGRIGQETQNWEIIKNICKRAIKRITLEEYQEWQRMRYLTILGNLKDYAERKGEAPHELIRIFQMEGDSNKTDEENRNAFDESIDNIFSLRPELLGKFNETIRHKLALAIDFNQFDEALNIFLENEHLPIYDFQFLIPVTKHLVRIGKKERAWQIIKDSVSKWIPTDIVEIAPIALLVDKDLKTIMNHEYCLEVLKIPRGYGV